MVIWLHIDLKLNQYENKIRGNNIDTSTRCKLYKWLNITLYNGGPVTKLWLNITLYNGGPVPNLWLNITLYNGGSTKIVIEYNIV